MFWRKETANPPAKREPPQIGGRYVLTGFKRDPWSIKRQVGVTVIDCREGWVRFRMDGSPCDDVKPVQDFSAIYVPENRN